MGELHRRTCRQNASKYSWVAFAALAFSWLFTPAVARADRLWWDGSRDAAEDPPGKLLSDNAGYWGDCVLTGVDYTYETEPTNPADLWRDSKDRFGRRLLDGRPAGNWWVPVGVNPGTPMVVTFDFKRDCTFSEIDVCTRTRKVAITAQCADDAAGPWHPVLSRGLDQCPESVFQRLPVSPAVPGRFLRLTIQGQGVTYVEEVLVWGTAEVSAATPEDLRPLAPTPVITGTAFASIPGIEKTSFSDAQFWEWKADLGDLAEQAAVWSTVSTWDSITDRPIVPDPAAVNPPVALDMARNETECVALTLTNTSMTEPRRLKVDLSSFAAVNGAAAAGVTGVLRVAGAIPSRHFGTNLGPLFEAENILPTGLLRRYLTNGAEIAGFPWITLPPAGSVVFWLSVTTRGAEPGTYRAALSCGGGPRIDILVTVLDVMLPEPFVWLNTWSGTTPMFPFVYADRLEREVAYKQSLGITVWDGWPDPGTPMALARKGGRAVYRIWGIGDYGHALYAGRIDAAALTAEDEKKIGEIIHGHVAKARELGLDYDDWYVELTDEPGLKNSLAFGALCRLVRKADPQVHIYCNPCFWEGNGVLDDARVAAVLEPWYRDHVDISVPLYLLLRDRPACLELFSSPRFVRASYTVSTQSAKSERSAQVELYRRQAWEAFERGWNGWGFYSYYGPRGDPWNDGDADRATNEDLPDYLMVYPGPRGPIPTRQSEAVRQGWEEYRLLTLLRSQGQDAELHRILAAYATGASLSELRQRALNAAAGMKLPARPEPPR